MTQSNDTKPSSPTNLDLGQERHHEQRELYESHPHPFALIDIHLHLDGSLSLKNARQLLSMMKDAPPQIRSKLPDTSEIDDEELAERLSIDEGCSDLNEYLSKFDYPSYLLQTKEQLRVATLTLLNELQELGLIYTELRFAPQRQTWGGLSQREAVEAVMLGMQEAELTSSLILCCMRADDNLAQNRETLELACEYYGRGVDALDLAGAEALFPTANFAELFEEASRYGLPFTIHAGEADGPDSVRAALAMGAKRIGHGVRSYEDKVLLRELAREGVVLELCPTSNLNTAVFSSLQQYPIEQFLDAGVKLSINADNMAVSNTHVGRELALIKEEFSLSDSDIAQFVVSALDAAFIDNERKAKLRASLEGRLPALRLVL